MRHGRLLALAFCLVTLGLAGFGCGPYGDICKTLRDCEGGNDKDEKACEDAWKANESFASDYGCSDNFNTYRDCIHTTLTCSGGQPTASCDAQQQSVEACEAANSSHML
jgi:hypothetical protein